MDKLEKFETEPINNNELENYKSNKIKSKNKNKVRNKYIKTIFIIIILSLLIIILYILITKITKENKEKIYNNNNYIVLIGDIGGIHSKLRLLNMTSNISSTPIILKELNEIT